MQEHVSASSIDVVLDQHTGSLRETAHAGEAGTVLDDLSPAAQELVSEASRMRCPLRLVTTDETEGLEPPAGSGQRVLVAADRVVRGRAADRGWTAVPHPALAPAVARGDTLLFASLTGGLEAIAGVPGLVAYWVESRPDGSSWVLAALPRAALAHVIDARLSLQRLALDVAREDPLLVQLDDGARAGDALAGYEVLWTDATRVLVALDAGTHNDEIPAHGAHGHFRFLTPSPELLAPARVVVPGGADEPAATASVQAPVQPAPVTPASYLADVARYAGLAPLDAAGALRSRHSSHPDNARAVDALLAELRELGYVASTHGFAFGGRIVRNVLADLPGSGELGVDAGLIVVGCHLDSTAARDPGYVPRSDPARGADDDASGMAALLAIARHLPSIRDRIHHTVRFGFFNAEESGLVGSRAYAASLKAVGAPVTAVVCADMIGYNSDEQRSWEVHAGHTNPRVRDLSLPLARVVAGSAATLGELPPPQIYSGTTPTGGTDPARFDGAINRSDHASFHEQGYPAVLVSEDFFPNRPGDPAADPNPNYHSDSDVEIDGRYAADITQAIGLAVAELATRPGTLPA